MRDVQEGRIQQGRYRLFRTSYFDIPLWSFSLLLPLPASWQHPSPAVRVRILGLMSLLPVLAGRGNNRVELAGSASPLWRGYCPRIAG